MSNIKFFYVLCLFGVIVGYLFSEDSKSERSMQYLLALEQCPGSNYHYTIHGLWPNYDHKHWPQFCNTSRKFDMSRLSALMPQINKYWRTCKIYNNTEKWFLQHEWLKHGTCIPGELTEAQYFGTALSLYHMINWTKLCPLKSSNCYIQIGGTYYGPLLKAIPIKLSHT